MDKEISIERIVQEGGAVVLELKLIKIWLLGVAKSLCKSF